MLCFTSKEAEVQDLYDLHSGTQLWIGLAIREAKLPPNRVAEVPAWTSLSECP